MVPIGELCPYWNDADLSTFLALAEETWAPSVAQCDRAHAQESQQFQMSARERFRQSQKVLYGHGKFSTCKG